MLGEPVKQYVCINLPEKQRIAAHQAVEGWDHALHQWKHLIAVDIKPITPDGEEPPHCDTFVHEVVTDQGGSDFHSGAWASQVGGMVIFMRKGYYELDTRGILLHELGHVLGAQHLPGTLMSPTYFKYDFECPDGPTVAQVAAWNQVDLNLLCWCQNGGEPSQAGTANDMLGGPGGS